MILNKATATLTCGTHLTTGKMIFTGNEIILLPGKMIGRSGKTVLLNGESVLPCIKIISPGGKTVLLYGKIVFADGKKEKTAVTCAGANNKILIHNNLKNIVNEKVMQSRFIGMRLAMITN
jgi:hypothetical protein